MSQSDQIFPCALTRRTFCVQAGEAAGLAALAAMLPGCGGDSPTSPTSSAPPLPTLGGTVSSGVLSVTIDPAGALGNVGGAALVQSSNTMVLVSRTGTSTFTAVTAVCTHEGCTVTGFQNARYVCPCHGSQYSTSGAVVNGPATVALRQFATQFNNNVLSVTL